MRGSPQTCPMTTRTAKARDLALRERQRAFIRKAANWAGWTPTELARAAGLAPSTLNRFLNQEVAHVLSAKTLDAIRTAVAGHFGSSSDYTPDQVQTLLRRIEAGVEDPTANVTLLGSPNLDVCGAVQAGSFTEAVEWPHDDRYPSPLAEDPRYSSFMQYVLEVRGNSMDELYPEGSFVICVRFMDLQRSPVVSEIVVTLRRDSHHDGYEATLKELRQAPDGSYWLWPRSSDPSHRPVKVEGFDDGSADNDDVVVWALVIGGYRAEPRRDEHQDT